VNILDTDIVTFLQRGSGEEYSAINENLSLSRGDIGIAIVTFEEQMKGWLSKCTRAKTPDEYVRYSFKLRLALDYYRDKIVLDFDAAAAMHYRGLSHLKTRIGTMDLRIASIARSLNATLVTRNTADFRHVPGLRVEDWTIPPEKP
jgi:tRNA(fMet)-specific endonuclease VapC